MISEAIGGGSGGTSAAFEGSGGVLFQFEADPPTVTMQVDTAAPPAAAAADAAAVGSVSGPRARLSASLGGILACKRAPPLATNNNSNRKRGA